MQGVAGGGERQGDTDLDAGSTDAGLKPTNREIMT